MTKSHKKCVICGKEFPCSPSDKTVTCSPACRSERARRALFSLSSSSSPGDTPKAFASVRICFCVQSRFPLSMQLIVERLVYPAFLASSSCDIPFASRNLLILSPNVPTFVTSLLLYYILSLPKSQHLLTMYNQQKYNSKFVDFCLSKYVDFLQTRCYNIDVDR